MSGLPTVNVVDDEEMSSQGSVNAPVAHPSSPTQGQVTAQAPTAPVYLSPSLGTLATQQSGVAGTSRVTQTTVPIESTEVVAAPTVVVDAPTRAETKQAFDEVSSALHSVSSQHDAVRTEMETLSRGMEEMRVAHAGELETTAQVKEGLQRTMSASSLLEVRLGQAESEQMQTRSAAEEAKVASERAISQAERLREEQERTTQQVSSILTAQAEETQKRVQSATSVAIQTRQEVRTLSSLARTADITAKIASEKVERGIEAMENELQAQKALSVQEAQASRSAQDILARKLKEAQEMIQATTTTTQKYEAHLTTLTEKMATMERLVIEQRQKGQRLESELSATQDRIGGAERRAQLLEEENSKIRGELESWNEDYGQEEISPEVPVSASTSIPSAVSTVSLFEFSTPMSIDLGLGGIPISQVLSGPSSVFSTLAISMLGGTPGWFDLNPVNEGQQQIGGRRESFGSAFHGSSGNGNENGNGGEARHGSSGMPSSQGV